MVIHNNFREAKPEDVVGYDRGCPIRKKHTDVGYVKEFLKKYPDKFLGPKSELERILKE